MADKTIPDLSALTSVDRAADLLEVSHTSDSGNSKKSSVNNLLDLTSHPVGVDEVQTLTNKTITAPTVSSPALSGTVTGTYTLGGTPTFPSAVVTLTGSQTLTNKVLTSPTINAPTITNPTLTTDTVNEFTSSAGVTIDGVLLKDSKVNGSYIADSSVGNTQLSLGVSVQFASTSYSAVASGTTTIPFDDTVPQNTEGTEFMTVSITPKSASNILVVEVLGYYANSAAVTTSQALFQDSIANALAATPVYQATANGSVNISTTYQMVAGTTSSITFKVRTGGSGAGTVTFNGEGGSRKFGAITKSYIKVTEYKA